MARIPVLASQYLDGDLDDREFDLLSEMLRDDAAADEFVVSCYIHSQLIDLMSRRRVQSDAVGDSFAEVDVAELGMQPAGRANDWATMPSMPVRMGRPVANRASRPVWRKPAGLAAALLIAASVLVLALWSLSRPAIVAQLSQTAGCRWEAPDGELAVGSLLRAGQVLRLADGRALVAFGSGAQVVLEGPVELRLDSASAANLSRGRITTKVPTQAIGFAITSPLARFVDLGTEFSLRLDSNDGFELHVFDGLVEVEFAETDGANPNPLRISELSAVRYDAQSGEVVAQPIDMNERITL